MSNFLIKARSCWITPDGQVYPVDPETHDNNYPKSMGSLGRCEECCIRVSCHWGFKAGASYMQIPKRLTMPQEEVLQRIDDECGGINVSLHVDMVGTIRNISDLFQYLQ